MLATWMLYAVALGACAGFSALLLERAATFWGRTRRWIWMGAIAATLVGPALLWHRAGRASPTAATAPVRVDGTEAARPPGVRVPVLTSVEEALASAPTWVDRTFLGGWMAASALVLILLAGGSIRLARQRRRWRPTRMDGAQVLVSDDVGPAVVGFRAPYIVVPAWVEAAPAVTRRWVLRHEFEHLRARDPLIMTVAVAAAVILPWNPIVWWQLRRLRTAVELDCDSRVLRGAGRAARRAYGSLLLDLARARPTPRFAGAAFAERNTSLERRIRLMSDTSKPSLVRAIPFAAIAALTVIGFTMVPSPDRAGSRSDEGAGVMTTTAAETPDAPPASPRSIDDTPVTEAAPAAAPAAPEASTPVEEEQEMEPTFTPYDVSPKLLDADEARTAVEDAYPPLLREAGIGGTTVVWLFISSAGDVEAASVAESSGQAVLDEAALEAAEAMKFEPARNRDEPVDVWVQVPITFTTSTRR